MIKSEGRSFSVYLMALISIEQVIQTFKLMNLSFIMSEYRTNLSITCLSQPFYNPIRPVEQTFSCNSSSTGMLKTLNLSEASDWQ
jgi:hypothetical protein